MSDRYGYDLYNDGKVSFTESHMTYHIERETARKNSLNDSLQRNTRNNTARSNNSKPDKSQRGFGLGELILLLSALGWISFFIRLAFGR